jgi:sulfur-oxidizing protein SoxY
MKISRRGWLQKVSLLASSLLFNPGLVFAKKQDAEKAIDLIVGSNLMQDGRVQLTIPPLVENGNLVPLKVSVQSPMTQDDYVKAIYVIAEGNPLPNIFSAYLSPRSGRATVSTRVRLSDSQRVWAIAQMSDGVFWRGYADTRVTLSACTESL